MRVAGVHHSVHRHSVAKRLLVAVLVHALVHLRCELQKKEVAVQRTVCLVGRAVYFCMRFEVRALALVVLASDAPASGAGSYVPQPL